MPFTKYLLILILVFSPASLYSQDNEMRLGLYVVVSDLEVSKEFYEELFGNRAYFENEGFAGFSVSGGLFGVFLESSFTHDLTRGNNSVPYIQVDNIRDQFDRISRFSPEMVHDAVVVEGPISLFMFKDPDGNVIEFFSTGI